MTYLLWYLVYRLYLKMGGRGKWFTWWFALMLHGNLEKSLMADIYSKDEDFPKMLKTWLEHAAMGRSV